MTDLRALLEDKGIRRAVVIDDAFDEAPRPDELDDGDWANFFDDLGVKGNELLSSLYAAYDDTTPDDLKTSQDFIRVIWENRLQLPATANEHLFRTYEDTQTTERTGLDALVSKLEALNLVCTTMGKEFDEGAKRADLIFVDLFLGFHQSEEDMKRAIYRVSELVAERADTPPLVILMSRSPRLWEKRNEFRDKAGLLGSTFRVASKADLAKDGRLETLLARLANHYEDAKRVAAFVHAWDNGLQQAHKNFIQILRRLDLPDLAQVQALLLDFEGQMLGEYLLDVADRVLQHEIEAQAGTIATAQELNKIRLTKYPAPHLAGSPDLQDLVHRMIFQHVERLRLSYDGETPTIQYGDVLRWKNAKSGNLTNNVLLVETPACDLAREGLEHVLVLPGSLIPLTANDSSYGTTVPKTPVFRANNGSTYWIKWHLKERQTIPLQALRDGLRSEMKYVRLGRIRETYATEIQQRLLADMGRIGQPANPPVTFPVSISLYAVSPDQTARSVSVEGLGTVVCLWRAKGSCLDRLVLDEAVCDALKDMIQAYSTDNVYSAARPSLEAMKTDIGLFERFERGLIKVPQKDNKWEAEKGADNRIYLHIVRNVGVEDGSAIKGNHRNAPFVMKVSDILPSQGD